MFREYQRKPTILGLSGDRSPLSGVVFKHDSNRTEVFWCRVNAHPLLSLTFRTKLPGYLGFKSTHQSEMLSTPESMPITAIEHPWFVKRRQLLEQLQKIWSEGYVICPSHLLGFMNR